MIAKKASLDRESCDLLNGEFFQQWRLIGRARLSKNAWEPDYRSKFADQSEVTVVHLHLPSYDGGIVVAALY